MLAFNCTNGSNCPSLRIGYSSDECFDCTACVSECAAEAICAEAEGPAQFEHYPEFNADERRRLSGLFWESPLDPDGRPPDDG
jgi:succinate dehydrogenase/fumarate reductase-like Fe-S protein